MEVPVDPELSKRNLDARGYGANFTTLPEELGGKDVMIDWQFIDFNTNNDLWYDANGLAMVHKQLWKRQEYEQHLTDASIASNFYPVQGALVVKDTKLNRQVTIMPSHAMAGSAGLRNGSNMELMQNRRLLTHDNYGVSEPLNDQDSSGNGIESKATYLM